MITLSALSDAGPRAANEDAVFAGQLASGNYCLAVADGLGGHFGGAEASQIAIQHLQKMNPGSTSDLEKTFYAIHSEILERQTAENLTRMATTLTAVVIEESRLYGAHCGDTRCVLQRGDGIKKLTLEQTEAQRLLDAGKLTKDEFFFYPRRNILDSALGVAAGLRVVTFEYNLAPGDKIIITSDGVHELIRLRELLSIIRTIGSPDSLLEAVRSAIEEQGAEDNYSIACAIVI